jgi:hypothetical protein
MLSERDKISYAKAVLRRQYTGNSQTAGPLVTGKFYRITQFKTGDDFRNVGGPSRTGGYCSGWHMTGGIFEATGTTPTVWTKGSRLTELKVAELRTYADTVFTAATQTVTLVSTSFEGGGGGGQITFEKSILGMAIEQLLAEFDPDHTAASVASTFPRRAGGYRVLIG